jgi:hypothetical protein
VTLNVDVCPVQTTTPLEAVASVAISTWATDCGHVLSLLMLVTTRAPVPSLKPTLNPSSGVPGVMKSTVPNCELQEGSMTSPGKTPPLPSVPAPLKENFMQFDATM